MAHDVALGARETRRTRPARDPAESRCDPVAVTVERKPAVGSEVAALSLGPATEDGLHPLGQLPQLGLQVRLELETEVPFHRTGIHRVI